ncbi:DUF885 domain-containing protein [Exilibacterium tricleocarpae]|uniref:DUF885 domain-containing protein n=1 Tax=Exilibacterium tricleocarpae TaxID=2591008 RepID=A0A545U5F1_9GAMM|nr:DUF885 domain-containing protein [Exilibacterium tricleocarpae]TQV84692.1 DUF885 domain-containing protein [Exilibacterium tricleocarpae]
MTIRELFIIITAAALLTACSDNGRQVASETQTAPQATVTRAEIDTLVDTHTLAFMQSQPVLSTLLDIDEKLVGGKYNHRLPDYSPDGMNAVQSAMAAAAAQLDAVNRDGLSAKDRLHLDVVAVIDRYYAGHQPFSAGYIDTWGGHLPYIVNQIAGPLIDIPKAMQVQQRIASLEDARDYLARLQAFAPFTEQVLAKLKADESAGVILPKKLFGKTLTYFDNFLAATPAEHALVTTFSTRLEKVDALSAAQRQQLTQQAIDNVNAVVYPGYQKIAAFMREQEQRAPSNDGIWAQPGGADYYLHAIQFLGDSALSAAAIHTTGVNEVQRITTEMDGILKANGLTDGSVGERMMALNSDPRFLYEDSDAGRAQLLADLNTQVEEVMAKAPAMFATLPDADIEVRRIPVVSQAGEAGGFYTAPSLDGSRPGIYWINLRDMKANPSYSLKTLTYHEAVPGHHFQIALNMAQTDIGLLRQNAPFNAYVEGWALYSELLAKEMGMYQDDPWGDLGRLQAELYRAVRLVVDTGLHAKQWTREQAIDYFYQTTGNPITDVIAEIERYMAWPGQALGYKLGMLQFVELRAKAQTALGEAFDLREFHDLILLPGARPMAAVQRDVTAWIAAKQSG